MYTRRDLIDAYLGAHSNERYGGYYQESSAYNAALKAHHEAMQDGLERLFGLRLTNEGVSGTMTNLLLFKLFQSTAWSLVAVTGPWSGFLEAGLLVRRVEESGAPGVRIMAASDRIAALHGESRRHHLDMLDALLEVILGDRADLTFTPADLHALGVDDTEPSTSDYPLFEG